MSNHFPQLPAGLALASVAYSVSIAGVAPTVNSPFYNTDPDFWIGVPGIPNAFGGAVQFTTPGVFGTYDQDAYEAKLATAITNLCSAAAYFAGVTLAEAQAAVTVQRSWQWMDPAGNQASFTDAMVYPPAA